MHRKVTLVSAPAGFGKTTCIGEWANMLDHWQVAWLSLEPLDDDPVRFVACFLAALQKVDANLGQQIDAVLRSGQLPPGEVICTALLNDILKLESRFLLILDDFHFIQDQYILQVMQQLLVSIPPALHLVLITREDPPLPLARLRANNQLTEIRAKDLRFTRQDVDRFLNEVMGLSLSQADIAALEDKTEGWVAGLQLAAIAMQSPVSARGRANPSSFIAALSGSSRFILSYLTEQVLNQQPEEIQHFLLETSILDKLNGDLCAAVSGRSDSQVLLEQLYKQNLFLIPLDEERQWYRYHHLFSGLLRDLQSAFQQDKVVELHNRASLWFAQAGMANDAIQHALSAENYAMAVDLLERHALELIMQGYAKTVNGWVQALPEVWVSKSPKTHLAFAWALLLRGAYAQASKYLEQLRATWIDAHPVQLDISLHAEWLVMQSLVLYMQGKLDECLAMASQALKLAPDQDNRVQSLAYYVQASVYQLMGEYPQAVKIYQMAIQVSRAAENLVAEMMSTAGLAEMVFEQGQVRLAFEITSRAVERIEGSGVLHPISAIIYASLGDVYYQWYQIEDARRCFQRALQLSILGGSNTVTILCHMLLSRLAHIEGDLETAAGEIQKAVELVPVEAPEYVRQAVVSHQIRIFLALDRPAAAEMALHGEAISFGDHQAEAILADGRALRISLGDRISNSVGMLYNSILGVLIYQARAENDPARLKSAIEFAGRVIAGALKDQQIMVALEALLLRAQMHALMGDQPASTADYLQALKLSGTERLVGVFIEQGSPVADALQALVRRGQLRDIPQDYLAKMLGAFSRSHSWQDQQTVVDSTAAGMPASLVEPLTARELDVLRLMAEGLKYKEIADRLFISLNTVRFHVKAVYGKLNASNRTQAIELARQLRII